MSQNQHEEELIEEIAGGEFERVPVPASKWKGWKSFLGMYAGEHAAGTEFMIGPLFLTAGVSAFDLIVGLLIGNLLAVLSWRFLTAKIGVENRLTLYYQLEKICGKKLVIGYNLANGILFCFLAGAMITVSSTAVGIPFDMEMPKLTDTMPNGATWVIIVVIIGAVISLIASKGYDTVSKAANWMSPVIVLAFLACGIVALSQLGVKNLDDFWNIWRRFRTFSRSDKIYLLACGHLVMVRQRGHACGHVRPFGISLCQERKSGVDDRCRNVRGALYGLDCGGPALRSLSKIS